MNRVVSVSLLIITFTLVSGRCKASSMVIDNLDSVLFDLSQAVYSSNRVEFPVYFNSDDTINAVDFAFKFNQSSLILDTILNINTGLQSTYFLNPGDSVLRFSSYNLNTIPNLTNVALVRFFINSGTISIPDLYDLDVFLNGFRCAWRVFDGTNDIVSPDRMSGFSVFPIPACNKLNLINTLPSYFLLMDDLGRKVANGELAAGVVQVLDISGLDAGIYFISVVSSGSTQTRRILVVD